MTFHKKFIGDRAFYRSVLAIALPLMVQNGITNFVNLLDNIMIGRLGTEAMAAVSIVNQFIFIFNLVIFGTLAAAGIFSAQYHGLGDDTGIRYTFRFKLMGVFLVAVIGTLIIYLAGDELVSLFLHGDEVKGDLALAAELAHDYLSIMLFGLVPFAMSQVYASTLRETERTKVPMKSSILSLVINLVFNYLLIFGKLGFPALGVKGAAIATVLARCGELIYVAVWTHTHTGECKFIVGALRSLKLPKKLARAIAIKSLPLMMNEALWSLAVTIRTQSFSTRGLDVVAATSIALTILNLFNVVYISLGVSVSIVVGKKLGAGLLSEARDTARKMIAFSGTVTAGISVIIIALAKVFPMLYNTENSVRELATYMIIVSALVMPFCAFAQSSYFTIRSGGKVLITILFDSAFMWVIVVPVCYVLSRFTDIGIHLLYAICQSLEILKMAFGFFLLVKVDWVKKIVKKTDTGSLAPSDGGESLKENG